MNVYAETNFVLELALLQEQCQSCEDILRFCESGGARLVIPAYCLVEPFETLTRRHRERGRLATALTTELQQLARTSSYAQQIGTAQNMASLLVRSSDDEMNRMSATRVRLLRVAEIIPLGPTTMGDAATYQLRYDLSAQDAIVYASVLAHLTQHSPPTSCFLNKNSRDFDDPDIVDTLNRLNCRMLPRFDDGYAFVSSRAHSG